jgi:hypothetical protein
MVCARLWALKRKGFAVVAVLFHTTQIEVAVWQTLRWYARIHVGGRPTASARSRRRVPRRKSYPLSSSEDTRQTVSSPPYRTAFQRQSERKRVLSALVAYYSRAEHTKSSGFVQSDSQVPLPLPKISAIHFAFHPCFPHWTQWPSQHVDIWTLICAAGANTCIKATLSYVKGSRVQCACDKIQALTDRSHSFRLANVVCVCDFRLSILL